MCGTFSTASGIKWPSKATKILSEPDFFFMKPSKGLVGAPRKHSARKTKTFSSLN